MKILHTVQEVRRAWHIRNNSSILSNLAALEFVLLLYISRNAQLCQFWQSQLILGFASHNCGTHEEPSPPVPHTGLLLAPWWHQGWPHCLGVWLFRQHLLLQQLLLSPQGNLGKSILIQLIHFRIANDFNGGKICHDMHAQSDWGMD